MRRTLGLLIVAIILFAISTTIASRPRAVKQGQNRPAKANLELSRESNSAAHTSSSSPLTTFVSSTQTSSATALPASGKIYFNSDRDGNTEIYAINADGSNQARLTNNLAVDADPVWSSSNQKIAFVTNRDANFEIYTMDAAGNNQVRLTFNSGSDGAPVWSPNGQKIAFTTDRDGNAIGANQTRASVLQKIVDGVNVISEGNPQFTTTYGQAFYNNESNRAFVQLEYFGYMKRDLDGAGYTFWLGKLNQFSGNFVNAEMVLAFISSPEYRARFGQP